MNKYSLEYIFSRSLIACKKWSLSCTPPCSWTSEAAWIRARQRPCKP